MTWLLAAARKAVADNNCQIGWLPSGAVVDLPDGPVHGECQPLMRRIYAPHPETPADLAVLLHEIGHVRTFLVDAPHLENERAANEWALAWWRRYELPDYELAEASIERGYEAAVQRERAAAVQRERAAAVQRERAAA